MSSSGATQPELTVKALKWALDDAELITYYKAPITEWKSFRGIAMGVYSTLTASGTIDDCVQLVLDAERRGSSLIRADDISSWQAAEEPTSRLYSDLGIFRQLYKLVDSRAGRGSSEPITANLPDGTRYPIEAPTCSPSEIMTQLAQLKKMMVGMEAALASTLSR